MDFTKIVSMKTDKLEIFYESTKLAEYNFYYIPKVYWNVKKT